MVNKLFAGAFLAGAVTLCGFALLTVNAADSVTKIAPVRAGPPRAASETQRVSAHLFEVEAELRAANVSHLTPGQLARRTTHLDRLRDYRIAGVFPRNYDFPDDRVPYFVDRHGTRCAMAELIFQDGATELVARVSRTRNNASIPELATEPELLAWLDSAGLSAEEAARIQPTYGGLPMPDNDPQPRISSGYAVTSSFAAAMSGAAIAVTMTPSSSDLTARRKGAFAVASGALGVALGASKLNGGGAPAMLGAVNAGVGMVSMAIGFRSILASPRDHATPALQPALRAGIAPALSPADQPALGLLMNLRF